MNGDLRKASGCSRSGCAVADEVCGGRIVLALEGGYDLDCGHSVAESVRALAEPDPRAREYPAATPLATSPSSDFSRSPRPLLARTPSAAHPSLTHHAPRS